jgi:hypothetical protein
VKVLLQVLFYAAGHLWSVFAACNQLRDAPSDQAVRDALAALCPDPVPLEQRVNRLFAAQLPKRLLHLVRQAGIRPRLLLLDRGFGSREVIRYLYRARYGKAPSIQIEIRRDNEGKRLFPAGAHSNLPRRLLRARAKGSRGSRCGAGALSHDEDRVTLV